MKPTKPRKPIDKARPQGFAEEAAPFKGAPSVTSSRYQTVELGAGGRLVIPAPMRAALGMKVGDKLTVALEDDQLSIHTYDVAIRRVQALMKKVDPDNRLTVDNFLRWKRKEAAKERAEMDRWSSGDV